MIFANALGATLPPGATTGPAVEGKSGAAHFAPAAPSSSITPSSAPPVLPQASIATGTDTAWLVGGVLGLAALGFGIYKVTHKKH